MCVLRWKASFYDRDSGLLFSDVLIPNFRMTGNEGLEQFAALVAVEVDDVDTVFAQPIDATGEGAAFTDDQGADVKLAHEAAAVPAGGEGGDHHQVAIAALAAGAAKGVGLAVDAGIALLHAAIAA